MPIRVDATESMALGGFLKEMSLRIGTPQYVGPVLKWVHQELSDAFTEHMSVLAPSEPQRFHHVYEWGSADDPQSEIGNPRAKLWRDVLVGGGAERVATFEWMASKTIVPVVHEEAQGYVKQIHVFTWKAPVMEYETDITISPKRGNWLVFFTGPPGDNTPEDLRFSKDPITVAYPGGQAAHGAFTQEYVAWWAGEGASHIFNSRIRQLLEHDLANMPLQSTTGQFRSGTRSRAKELTINAMADAEAAEAAGREAARRWLDARSRNYIEAARAREMIIGAYDD